MDKVCITAASRRVDEPLIACAKVAIDPLVANTRSICEPIVAKTNRVDKPLTASSQRVDKPLVAHSRIVCIISSICYLRIEPQTVWLAESNDYSANVDVFSNVDWIIE